MFDKTHGGKLPQILFLTQFWYIQHFILQVDENEHDPHFEPIVPLPELVQVKTGEEDEQVKWHPWNKLPTFLKAKLFYIKGQSVRKSGTDSFFGFNLEKLELSYRFQTCMAGI